MGVTWRAAVLAAVAWLAAASSPASAEGCRYLATAADAAASSLDVEVECAGDGPHGFLPWPAVHGSYLTGLAGQAGSRVDNEGGRIAVTGAGGLSRFAYRIDLDGVARDGRWRYQAIRVDQALAAPLAVWVLQPERSDVALTLAVASDHGAGFATALQPGAGGYRLLSQDVTHAGYGVIGRFLTRRIPLAPPPGAGGVPATLDVAIMADRFAVGTDTLIDWFGEAAGVVADYFHGFPMARALLVLEPVAGRSGVVFGRVMSGGGGSVLMRVGERATRQELHGSWVLVHELSHLAMPFLTDRAMWFMEGMATYVEPILRARAGWIMPEAVWAEFAEGMVRGVAGIETKRVAQPASLYWGGALFMLIADIDMRRRSAGRLGLEHCLRRVLGEGGDSTRRWPQAPMIDACDALTGGRAMADLTADFLANRLAVDLASLWRELGVEIAAGTVKFDDGAPLASIRRGIVSGN